MKPLWRIVSFLGLSCTGLCTLGLPLLAVLVPALGLGWPLGKWVMRAMLAMFLGMYGLGTLAARRHHHHTGPLWSAIGGGTLLVLTAWHLLPHAFGWLALGALAASWCWDWSLLRICHDPASQRSHGS
jgi:hypothetical protein